ncbi:NAD(P)-binding protein [Zopfia rhizophila CBS 207.26]|uniref:NAD(P)-binding protein n=1 Tax=Zopfia rhizophila CBS 207.26 TaxID=1314779 RepID=A0A6A6E1G1_9PEZI|nr:NAD(P)-binding protein [Zopfia rhizophila CBS 207.26]
MAPEISAQQNVGFLKNLTKLPPLPKVKVVMITGGAGFIGSWATRSLTLLYKDHYHIVAFDKLDVAGSLNNIRELEDCPNFSFERGDIRSPTDVFNCLRRHKVDAVIHFAALSHVDTSFNSSYEFSQTNFLGTHVLLEAVRLYGGVKHFIHVSTDEVYGEKTTEADHVEEDSLNPTNPYSASKAAAEMIVSAYVKSFGIPCIIVRSNNVYGPNQFPEKVIPKFAMLFLRGQKIPLYGHGRHTRRYLYATDAANAINFILHRGKIGHVYNIGTYDEISNRNLSSILLRLTRPVNGSINSNLNLDSWIQPTPDRPFHDRRYGVDFGKLSKLGWKQTVDLEKGLKETVEWYRVNGEEWWGPLDEELVPRETGFFRGKSKEQC